MKLSSYFVCYVLCCAVLFLSMYWREYCGIFVLVFKFLFRVVAVHSARSIYVQIHLCVSSCALMEFRIKVRKLFHLFGQISRKWCNFYPMSKPKCPCIAHTNEIKWMKFRIPNWNRSLAIDSRSCMHNNRIECFNYLSHNMAELYHQLILLDLHFFFCVHHLLSFIYMILSYDTNTMRCDTKRHDAMRYNVM